MMKAKLVWRLPNKPKRWANVGSAAAAYFEANHFRLHHSGAAWFTT
jgi:hypothetical protein